MNTIKQLIQKLNLTSTSSGTLQSQGKRQAEHQQHMEGLKERMKKCYRPGWKASGVPHHNQQVLRLSTKQLDNWQISRIPLSKRSYCFPRNYHGFKNSSGGKEFSSFDSKDKKGHLPFLYEGDSAKIERIRSSVRGSHFQPINTAKNKYFGFTKMRYSMSEEKCTSKKGFSED